MPSELLARRPDIRRAEQELIAANAQIGVARANYFPTISLSGLFGYASTELSDLLSRLIRDLGYRRRCTGSDLHRWPDRRSGARLGGGPAPGPGRLHPDHPGRVS